MVKRPCYIARFPGDDRVEKQREESKARFYQNVYKECKFKGVLENTKLKQRH